MTSQNNLSQKLNNWDYIDRYSLWMYHVIQPYIGQCVFEVGAGMGRMVSYYINDVRKVVATDIFQNQIDYMNNRFCDHTYFNAVLLDILSSDLSEYEESFDTIICINVLEHLSDDYKAMENMKCLLKPEGKMIILVPAWKKLFSDLDRNVGHYRRYDPGMLDDIAKVCNLSIVRHQYFNRFGVIPYYLKGRNKLKRDESFSTSLNETNSKIYNFAATILEPFEKRFPPKKGLTEVMVLKKTV